VDEIIQILDDHLSSLQAILGTNFVDFIKDDVLKFEVARAGKTLGIGAGKIEGYGRFELVSFTKISN
jgi:hypothetical protein